MLELYLYTFISVILVSLISFIGAATFFIKTRNVNDYLLFLVSLSAGTLFGDAFIHLLPETIESQGFSMFVSLSILSGIVLFFILEKLVHMHHKDIPKAQKSMHHHAYYLGTMNLVGDGIHNFIDGLVIAGSFIVSVPVGIATTIAVIFHEIPQEIGDFGVLLYSGSSRRRALWFNFLSAVMAVLGAAVGLIIGESSKTFQEILLPFAAGGFLYIAGSNLIPELHRECGWKQSLLHFGAMLFGIGIMIVLKVVGG